LQLHHPASGAGRHTCFASNVGGVVFVNNDLATALRHGGGDDFVRVFGSIRTTAINRVHLASGQDMNPFRHLTRGNLGKPRCLKCDAAV
jgi:hypothetical protein